MFFFAQRPSHQNNRKQTNKTHADKISSIWPNSIPFTSFYFLDWLDSTRVLSLLQFLHVF